MVEPRSWRKFLYYTLGLTPPAETREWVERDINSAGFQVRRLVQVWTGILIGMAIIGPLLQGVTWQPWKSLLPGLLAGALVGGLIAGVLQATVFADYVRRRTLAYYGKKWGRQPTG